MKDRSQWRYNHVFPTLIVWGVRSSFEQEDIGWRQSSTIDLEQLPCIVDVWIVTSVRMLRTQRSLSTTVWIPFKLSSFDVPSDIKMSPCSILNTQWVGDELAWADQKIPEWSRDCVSGCRAADVGALRSVLQVCLSMRSMRGSFCRCHHRS